MKAIFHSLLIVLWLSVPLQAQKPVLYSSDGFLSSGLINDLCQDSRGYIWIATEYGLNRFDGIAFDTYYNIKDDATSLCNNYVHKVFEVSPGLMLAGCVNGLMEWHAASDSFSPVAIYADDSPVAAHITEIMRLSNGDILIGTAGYGVFRYDAGRHNTERLALPEPLNHEFISCIFEDSSHALWIGTEGDGLFRHYLAGGELRHYTTAQLGGCKTSDVAEDPATGDVFVASLDGGVAFFDRTRSSFVPLKYAGGEPISVKSLGFHNGRCLAGTEGRGVKIVTREGVADVDESSPVYSCTSGKVHQIVTDRDGNLWLGLYQQGVWLVPSRRCMFESYGRTSPTANPIGPGCVMAISPGTDNTLWVSCDNDGVYCLDPSRRRIRHLDFPSAATCLLCDSHGAMWAGTFSSGVFAIPDGSGTPRPVGAISANRIYCMAEGRDGFIYIGTFGRGLIRYNPATMTETYLSPTASRSAESNCPEDWINKICVAPDGRVWFAHYGGISCYNPSTGRLDRFEGAARLVDGCLGYAVAIGRSGTVWCGTSDGLYSYNQKTKVLRHFTMADGLPNEVICGICEDASGNIWVSTYHGIAKYVAAQNRFVTFDSGDGLQGNEFTHGAYCADSRGNIYFGGTGGFNAFYPFDIDDSPRQYHPVFTRFSIFSIPVTSATLSGGEPVIEGDLDEHGRVALSATDNTFKIQFSTFTFDNPDKLIYQYRVLEHGHGWLSTLPGQNHVTLANMKPGTYHFQVRVDGDTSPGGTRSLIIVVRPPWYQSWWAMLIYIVMGIVLLLIGLHFLRLRSMRRREIAEQRHAEEILEAKLIFFTNISHEIRTPITLIINPIEKLLNNCSDTSLKAVYSTIYRNARRILRLVNELMDMRRIEKGQMTMNFRPTDLVAFINNAIQPFEYISAENTVALRFHHTMESLEAWIDVDNFDKVITNVLSNAFRYTPAGGSIDITLTEGHDEKAPAPMRHYFEVAVADTGIGIDPEKIEKIFDRFYRIENELTSSSVGTGIGLHLSRSIVQLHHGVIGAANREEGGCVFTIRCPMGSAHLSAAELADTTSAVHLPEHARSSLLTKEDAAMAGKPRTRYTVAVVEDDSEIRTYLAAELSGEYRVKAFSGADEALKSVLSDNAPDVIISDVMMPGTDGLALCQRIKQNVNINHTPVILLSARADDADRMEGLRCGADAYLTKPFSTSVLMSTISSLLANRHLLKAKFSGAQEADGSVRDIKLKSQDEILLAKIMDVINANISSPDFSVERLAAEVGLSRVHLHRKLKEFTDLSARDFIRSLRMKQAARLLREKNLSVAEVAYATGFANPSHFSSTFKEMFGVTPTAYASRPTDDSPE